MGMTTSTSELILNFLVFLRASEELAVVDSANQPFDGEVGDNIVGWETVLSRCCILGIKETKYAQGIIRCHGQKHFREGVGFMGLYLPE